MKLEWKETEPEKMNWYKAKELEKDGWILPTRAELVNAYDTSINGFKPILYWSSSMYAQSNSYAWYVDFDDGYVNYNSKTADYYVRLCREVK